MSLKQRKISSQGGLPRPLVLMSLLCNCFYIAGDFVDPNVALNSCKTDILVITHMQQQHKILIDCRVSMYHHLLNPMWSIKPP